MSKELRCPSCGGIIIYKWSDRSAICPICNMRVDIRQMEAVQAVAGHDKVNVLKYEGGSDVIVWKHPIQNIKYGSQLIVQESQEAVFYKNGKALDSFGPGKYSLSTEKLPLLSRMFSSSSKQELFQSEVYFVSLSTHLGIKWGTDTKVRVFDPNSNLYLELGACGTFSIRVSEARKLLVKVIGTGQGLTNTDIIGDPSNYYGVGKYRALVMSKVKTNLARLIKENQINILEIDAYLDILSDTMRKEINVTLDDYGLIMPEFYITAIMTPDDDPNFRRLKQQFADKTLRVREEEIKKSEAEAARERRRVEAETSAELKRIEAAGSAEALKLKAEAEAEAYKMQALAEATEMRAKGYTYQQETSRQVGLEAMQNGITGGEGAPSQLGGIAGLGVALGAMGGVIGMTKEAISPVLNDTTQIGRTVTDNVRDDISTWNCTDCNTQGITSRFCPNCGKQRVSVIAIQGWNCSKCGTVNIQSNFCPNCGNKREETTWSCSKCGTVGIRSKFCPNCGNGRDS